MTREQFLKFLTRSVSDGLMSEREASALLRRFDAGDLDDDSLPLPLEESIPPITEASMEAALVALVASGLLSAALSKLRDRQREELREKLQDRFMERAREISEGLKSVQSWQREAGNLITNHVLQQAMVGSGRARVDLEVYGPRIREQLAFHSRFADELSTRLLLERVMSEKAIAHRMEMYAGEGRTVWFVAAEAEAGEGYIVRYSAIDDDGTCEPCLASEGDYLPGDPDSPFPGSVCRGKGFCRCVRELIFDPAAARELKEAA